MIVVAFVSFSLFNFVGDPVNSMTGEDASDERRAEVCLLYTSDAADE